jgi:uncharacterized protein YdhG (YjbR/CyaY superfamily)
MKIEELYRKLSAPARRALQSLGLSSVEDLARFDRSAIAELHGVGPNALKTIEAELAALKLGFGGAAAAEQPVQETSSVIDEYIAGFAPHIQEKLAEMRRIIREAAPDAKEKLSYKIPTFDLFGNLVHFAGYERHIGFYPGSKGIEVFRQELSAYKSAKGSVQFPLDQPLPAKLIRKIVLFRADENRKKAEKAKRKK